MDLQLRPWNPLETLTSDDDQIGYIDAVIEDCGDLSISGRRDVLVSALGHIAKDRGIVDLDERLEAGCDAIGRACEDEPEKSASNAKILWNVFGFGGEGPVRTG